MAKVARAYTQDSANEEYTRRFQHLFLDVAAAPLPADVASAKPAGVDDARWRAAAEAVDSLYRELSAEVGAEHCGAVRNLAPTPTHGLEGLKARVAKQDAALAEQRAFAEGAERVLAEEQGRMLGQLQLRAQNARQVHVEQRHKLVAMQRRLEALYEAPLALPYVNEVERQLMARIDALQREVPPPRGAGRKGGLALRLEELAAAAVMRAGAHSAGQAAGSGANGGGTARLDDASAEQLMGVLAQQTEALRSLTKAMRDARRDMAVLEAAAAPAGVQAT